MCQNYSLTAEELQYKWEAHNFRATVTRSEISPYTLESFNTLKTQIQRDRAAKKPPPPRTSIATSISAFRNQNPAARAPVQVKLEPNADGFGMGMEGIAGPSTVVFKGPSDDASARKKRACAWID
jgi:DNA polymerase alpha subunit B